MTHVAVDHGACEWCHGPGPCRPDGGIGLVCDVCVADAYRASARAEALKVAA